MNIDDSSLVPWMVTLSKINEDGVSVRKERVMAKAQEQAKLIVNLRMRNDQRDAMGNSGWILEKAERLVEPGGSDEQETG